jgi:uncharacterized protein involved in tellurium resistance
MLEQLDGGALLDQFERSNFAGVLEDNGINADLCTFKGQPYVLVDASRKVVEALPYSECPFPVYCNEGNLQPVT